MRGGWTTIATVTALVALAPASASATPQDVAATHAYITANFALARAGQAQAGNAQARVVQRSRQFARECPNAGKGSPENEESQRMSYEAAGALWSVTYGANAGAIRAFARAVKPLRWSNPKLTRLAAGYASGLLALATLGLPDLCGDVRAWSASGFHTIPAATLRFDEHVEAIEAHAIPARLLAPYEQPADRGVLARTTRLEAKLEEIEFGRGFDDWLSLLESLGLHQ